MAENVSVTTTPWDELAQLIDSDNAQAVETFVYLMPPGEVPYNISRLDLERRSKLFGMVKPEVAAEFLDHFADELAADVIESLPPETAADIVEELPSDDAADVLAEIEPAEAEAIIEQMEPEEAADARALVSFEYDTAGGVMETEYLAYHRSKTVGDVINDLRANQEKYAEYDARYLYIMDDVEKLVGVIRLRTMILAAGTNKLENLVKGQPVKVRADTPVEDLEDIFDRHTFTAIPVVDAYDRLIGVVQEAAVEEALGEFAEDALLKAQGIIAGEEFRTMPIGSRTLRRMAFLLPSAGLLLVSISVIALYEESILSKLPSLAKFLPLVAGLCGCAGNQAVAVSLRELALGLVKPADIGRVIGKEILVGLLNGLVLGLVLFGVSWVWTDELMFGVAVGGAVLIGNGFAAVIGGLLPLFLRGAGIDPAMGSGPLLTTMVDFISFFLTLTLAYLLMGAVL